MPQIVVTTAITVFLIKRRRLAPPFFLYSNH
jgi:hypothetical protein